MNPQVDTHVRHNGTFAILLIKIERPEVKNWNITAILLCGRGKEREQNIINDEERHKTIQNLAFIYIHFAITILNNHDH